MILQPWHSAAGSAWGLAACLGAAGSYAAGYVYADRMTTSHDAGTVGGLTPLGLAASQLIAAAILLLAGGYREGGPLSTRAASSAFGRFAPKAG